MFYTKIITIFIIAASLMFLGSEMIRKYLKVERRKIFSYDHVNEKHKKLIGQLGLSL